MEIFARPLLVAAVTSCLFLPTDAHAQTAKQAAQALPERFRNTIVKVSSENATSGSAEWVFVCRASHSDDGLLSVKMKGGRMADRRPAPEERALVADQVPIDFSRVLVDSRGAWEVARRYVANKQNGDLSRVNMILEQPMPDSSPVWSIFCFDPNGQYLGSLKLTADSGEVIFWE